MSFQDTIDNSIKYDMLQAADFLGYIISYDYSPTLCDETLYNYYDEKTDLCKRHYNTQHFQIYIYQIFVVMGNLVEIKLNVLGQSPIVVCIIQVLIYGHIIKKHI
jgi:hypothetical protein